MNSKRPMRGEKNSQLGADFVKMFVSFAPFFFYNFLEPLPMS